MRLTDPEKIRFLRQAMDFCGAISMPGEFTTDFQPQKNLSENHIQGSVLVRGIGDFRYFPMFWHTEESQILHENLQMERKLTPKGKEIGDLYDKS